MQTSGFFILAVAICLIKILLSRIGWVFDGLYYSTRLVIMTFLRTLLFASRTQALKKGHMDQAGINRLVKGKWAIVATVAIALMSILLVLLAYYLNSQHVVIFEFRTVDVHPGERAVWEVVFDLVFIVLLGLIAFIYTRHFGVFKAFPVAIIFSLVFLELAYWLSSLGHRVNILFPLISMFISLLISGAFRYFVLERGVRELRSIFSSYHSDKLVARLEVNPGAAKIGGDNKDVTIIFTDIKGFTAFSEQRMPIEVVARLNEYLGEMVQIIDEFDGYLDKFIGDGIMAYWGAPLAQEDHANLAIACLLAMQNSMHKLQLKWQEAGEEPFSIRAGVQSGEVVAGNIGLRGKKMEYTVIGDTVNQAARLETSAKYYGIDMLVGEGTYLRTRDLYSYRELDRVRMVGKMLPVTVYELIGPISDGPGRLQKLFAEALEIYRSQNWSEAEKVFSALVLEYPQDKPSAMYLERCQYFLRHPAASDWDGVFVRNAK